MEVIDTILTTFYGVGNEVQIVEMLSTRPTSWKDVSQDAPSGFQFLSDPLRFLPTRQLSAYSRCWLVLYLQFSCHSRVGDWNEYGLGCAQWVGSCL